MSILDKIVAKKRIEIEERKSDRPLDSFIDKTGNGKDRFISRDKKSLEIIAEIKRASPSKGDIALNLNPYDKAVEYENGGAKAISVLTDGPFFKGSLNDLREVKKGVNLPVLRKDFIIDEYQIYESSFHGSDALLLIARILKRDEINALYEKALSLGIVPLIEVFSKKDLDVIKDLKSCFVGINNRNLKSFETSLDNSIYMAEKIDDSHFPVALSGVMSANDVKYLYDRGLKKFLIGEYLSGADDPSYLISKIIKECE